jgi:low temperature requirement protein LtrA
MIGLMIGFGIWWTYFDFVGRRFPRAGRQSLWMAGHLPVVMAIAGSGAAMVGIIEHAGDDRTPAAAAWLLSGSVAVALVALLAIMTTLSDFERLASIYRPLTRGMAAAAVAAMLIGWWRPSPWLLALSMVVILSLVWWLAVDRWLRLDDLDDVRPGAA